MGNESGRRGKRVDVLTYFLIGIYRAPMTSCRLSFEWFPFCLVGGKKTRLGFVLDNAGNRERQLHMLHTDAVARPHNSLGLFGIPVLLEAPDQCCVLLRRSLIP